MSDRIAAGNDIIIRGGDIQRLVAVKPGLQLKLGRLGNVNAGSLIGQYFDSSYVVDETAGKKFVRVTDDMLPDLEAEMLADDVNAVASNLAAGSASAPVGNAAAESVVSTEQQQQQQQVEANRDNRRLVDTNTAQSLTFDEIQELKDKEGVSSVVNHLVQNSTTFASKTAFAQEKYIKRKKIKYNNVFRIERPTVASLCELWCPSIVRGYNETDPPKFLRLRVDAIAQILSLGNVCHNSNVMVYEKTNGFMCAAVLDRMSDAGRVYHILPPKAHANIKIGDTLGLKSIKERWKGIKLEDLIPSVGQFMMEKKRAAGADEGGGDDGQQPAQEDGKKEDDENKESAGAATAAAAAAVSAGAGAGGRIRMEMRKDEVEALLTSKSRPRTPKNAIFDTLIVADDEDPSVIAAALFPFVRMSGQIVVYSPYVQQLAEIHGRLRDDVVGAKIQETWLREIQVLPNRTHPVVNMSHTGGYIFSGTKVDPLSVVRPPGSRFSDLKAAARQQQQQGEGQQGTRRDRE